jgi:GNAT superfamily N-acetyltransferase
MTFKLPRPRGPASGRSALLAWPPRARRRQTGHVGLAGCAGYGYGMAGPRRTEPRRLDLSDPDALQRLWVLQRASYAVEAELIGFDGIPALHESLQELRDCGESFLGLDDETGLAGAVSWARLQDGTLDICRLIVHPRVHRRGIATALLDSLDRAEPARRAVVSTGTANHPALALYKRRGFTPVGTRGIAPGTSITVLERWITPPSDPPIQKPR